MKKGLAPPFAHTHNHEIQPQTPAIPQLLPQPNVKNRGGFGFTHTHPTQNTGRVPTIATARK